MHVFISFYIVNKFHMKNAVFCFSKNYHDYKCDIDFFYNSSINKKLRDLIPITVTALFCVSEHHDSDSFLNDSIV